MKARGWPIVALRAPEAQNQRARAHARERDVVEL